jgi:acyl dehydratase
MHGLCTYGFSGRALIADLGNGDAAAITAIDARFTKPVFPGETLTTLIWRTEPGKAVFRTEASGASGPEAPPARLVLEDGAVEYTEV